MASLITRWKTICMHFYSTAAAAAASSSSCKGDHPMNLLIECANWLHVLKALTDYYAVVLKRLGWTRRILVVVALLLLHFQGHIVVIEGKVESSIKYNQLKDRIVADIENVMSCRNIPGTSVSVLFKDRDVLTRGFGFANIGTNTTVDEHTPFMMASISKMFTATLVGVLLGRNQRRYPLGFDTLVMDVMGPDFTMSSDLRTKYATVKDVLSHRLGLPTYRWPQMMAMDSSRSMQDYCRRLRYLEPLKNAFRDKFRYSNMMYVLAGCIAERLGGGAPLSDLLRDNIFKPLHMRNTTTIRAFERDYLGVDVGLGGVGGRAPEIKKWGRMSRIYYMNDTSLELHEINLDIIRSSEFLEAAGGLVSTAADMKLWMAMLLRNGRISNSAQTEIMPARYWTEMFKPHVAAAGTISMQVQPLYPVLDTVDSMGLGWMLGYYRGALKRMHEGRLAGFESKLTVLPQYGIAVFTVSNGPQYRGTNFNRVIQYLILDALLNATSWLNNSSLGNGTACTYPQPWQPKRPYVPSPVVEYIHRETFEDGVLGRMDNESINGTFDAEGEFPSLFNLSSNSTHHAVEVYGYHVLSNLTAARYVGTYGHSLFGNITITYNITDRHLYLRYGLIGSGRLVVYNSTWYLDLNGALWFYNRIYDNRNIVLKMEFLARSKDADQFTKLRAVGFEETAPPMFVRNLRWDAVDRDATPARYAVSSGHVETSVQTSRLGSVVVLFVGWFCGYAALMSGT